MRGRQLWKLLIAVAGALAVIPATASAHWVQLLDEATGEHCSAFTVQGHEPVGASCTLAMTSQGSTSFINHSGLSESVERACTIDFEAAFGTAGEGYVYNQTMTPESPVCAVEPCDEPATGVVPHQNRAWPATIAAAPGGQETLTMALCLNSHTGSPDPEGGADYSCEVVLTMETSQHGHTFSTAGDDGATPCVGVSWLEVQGEWLTSRTPTHPHDVEVAHYLPDSVEVSEEGGGHCPEIAMTEHVPTGGCDIAFASEAPIETYIHNGISEVHTGACDQYLEGRFDEAGTGYVYGQAVTGPGCVLVPCDEPDMAPNPHRQLPWQGEIHEAIGGGIALRMFMCVRSMSASEGVGLTCDVRLDMTADDHGLELTAGAGEGQGNGTPCANAPALETSGHWTSSPDAAHPDELEVAHAP